MRGNSGNHVPIDHASESEIESRRRIRFLQTAQLQNALARPEQVVRLGRVSAKPQRKICLDGGIHFGRSAGKNVPSPIAKLPSANVCRKLRDSLAIEAPQNMAIKDVVRL